MAFTSVSISEKTAEVDYLLGNNFPGQNVTSKSLLKALMIDPSGAAWLEEMARNEFKNDQLGLTGALKAVAGARKMHSMLAITYRA